ncbi:unnamed protein product [Trichobilharzia szidati]|nr:unnamed protein product [Trichobilharzia szidati]
MTTYSSGSVKLFDHDLTTETLQLFVKGHLCAARLTAGQIAVGGKDVSLRIWDINNPKEPVFTAKNVRPSVLQLAEPIWISDISFVPRTNGKLVLTASRHGELDLYDLRCGQRRPVARHAWRTSRKHGKLHVGSGKHSAVLPDLATTRPITRALVYDNSPGVGLRVVAGNAVGELSVLDLRLPQEYSNISDCDSSIPIPVKSYGSRAPEPPSGVRCLAGASGCITQLVCGGADEGNTALSSIEAVVNDEPIILVSSLDRYMRIYNRDTGKRLGKIYVKFPITSFLVNSTTSFTNLEKFLKKSDGDHAANDPESHDESHNISETEQKEFDELWSQIPVAENDVDATSNKDNEETVNHKVSKRKRKK